jgi:predicted SnoaL-like aldol condensation-catalyzing enzyme
MSDRGDSAQDRLRANKAIVQQALPLLMDPATLETAAQQYLAENYVQHNPNLGSGREALVRFTRQVLAGEVKLPETAGAPLCLAEGDYVVMMLPVRRPDPVRPGDTYMAYVFDMWRIENGKLAEHWDAETKTG